MMQVIRVIKDVNDIVIPKGMNRVIKNIVYHCTAGPQSQSTQEIFNYWKNHNGWTTVGYHFDIAADGTIEQLQEIDKLSNGVKGHNANSIHICYKGGINSAGKPVDNRTNAQKQSMISLMLRFKILFPNAIHLGHRDFSLDLNGDGIIEAWEWIKSCPSLDLRDWIASLHLDSAITPSRIVYKLNNPLIKNETVGAIQRALEISVDNYFGINTDKSVKIFQGKAGLTSDGIVGKNTAIKLIEKLQSVPTNLIPGSDGMKAINLLTEIATK